jgi:hypothetical protein
MTLVPPSKVEPNTYFLGAVAGDERETRVAERIHPMPVG